MLLRFQMVVQHTLSCYTINHDGTYGCHVTFVEKEFMVGKNWHRLNGSISDVLKVKPDDESRSMPSHYHLNHGYAYARVVEDLKQNKNQNENAVIQMIFQLIIHFKIIIQLSIINYYLI